MHVHTGITHTCTCIYFHMQILYMMIQHWFKWSSGTSRNQLTLHRNIAYESVRDPSTPNVSATTIVDGDTTGMATNSAQNPGFSEQDNVYASVHQQLTHPDSHHTQLSSSYGYTTPQLMGFENGQGGSELEATVGASSDSLTSLTQRSSQGSRTSLPRYKRKRGMGKLGHHHSKIKRLSPSVRSPSNGSRSDVHSYVNTPNVHEDLIHSVSSTGSNSGRHSRQHTLNTKYDRMTS